MQQNVNHHENEHHQTTEDVPDIFEVHENMDMSPNVQLPSNMQSAQNEHHTQYAFVAQYAKPIEYALLMRHVGRRKNFDFNSRTKYVLLLLALLAPTLAGAQDTCARQPAREEEDQVLRFWIISCLVLQLFAMFGVFLLGRYFGGKSTEPVIKYDIGIQKNEPIVGQRLREQVRELRDELRISKFEANNSLEAAREARAAQALSQEEVFALSDLVLNAQSLVRALEREMDECAEKCSFNHEIYMSKKGICWHHRDCHIVEQLCEANKMVMKGCCYCVAGGTPPDRMVYPRGWCLRQDIQAWLQSYAAFSHGSR